VFFVSIFLSWSLESMHYSDVGLALIYSTLNLHFPSIILVPLHQYSLFYGFILSSNFFPFVYHVEEISSWYTLSEMEPKVYLPLDSSGSLK
jgi:hypothetical protein